MPASFPADRLREIEPEALSPARKGRGARTNPTGRFERTRIEPDLAALETAGPLLASETRDASRDPPRTRTLPDRSRRVLSRNDSPDLPFEASLNPYRGCEHGCVYCYARPTHELLGYSAGLDFETKILVKDEAPRLLRRELSSPRWIPRTVMLSGVTDAYQPIERRLEITRRCIRVFADFRNPIRLVTKNALVARDVDLLRELAEFRAVSVALSITTLDSDLQRALEPRASSSAERLRALERLSSAGIPTGVMVAPVIPGLTDSETPRILEAARSAGARWASQTVLRLPHGLPSLFDDWLATHRPLRRKKVLHRLEALRGGRLDDPRFGSRMRGEGRFAEQIADLFRLSARRHGLEGSPPGLSTDAFRRPGGAQLAFAFGTSNAAAREPAERDPGSCPE
ncbi:MAG TPA: PA0069 family radical SAM protein [Deltaproteobacteria bacterium]|nr:PA0069 family radical SAM protein [Deltaproteobacteria bacterium]